MTWFLWITLSLADDACHSITLPDITAVPESAIIVLGERRGAAVDTARALKAIRGLQKKTNGPVTVALDIVHHKYQHVFEQYTSGSLEVTRLEEALSWSTQTEAAFTPYRKLIDAARAQGSIHGVGSDLSATPKDISPPIPGVYPALINSVIPDGDLAFGMDAKIAKTMAYWDYQIANRALNEWDGQGYLVILTERARVEGGGGVPWQLVRAQDKPVYSFLLAWAESYCTPGDNVWSKNPLFSTLGLTP